MGVQGFHGPVSFFFAFLSLEVVIDGTTRWGTLSDKADYFNGFVASSPWGVRNSTYPFWSFPLYFQLAVFSFFFLNSDVWQPFSPNPFK